MEYLAYLYKYPQWSRVELQITNHNPIQYEYYHFALIIPDLIGMNGRKWGEGDLLSLKMSGENERERFPSKLRSRLDDFFSQKNDLDVDTVGNILYLSRHLQDVFICLTYRLITLSSFYKLSTLLIAGLCVAQFPQAGSSQAQPFFTTSITHFLTPQVVFRKLPFCSRARPLLGERSEKRNDFWPTRNHLFTSRRCIQSTLSSLPLASTYLFWPCCFSPRYGRFWR